MSNKIINVKSLKEQVYEYLKKQIHTRKLRQGDVINMDKTSKKLGISKTPLRDALIQLEMEGFVTIEARKGIYVNTLTLDNIREFYEIIGALEASAVLTGFASLKSVHLDTMKTLNLEMSEAISAEKFKVFYKKNLKFHDTYINLSGNNTLITTVSNLKKRLYDFPGQDIWIKEWELESLKDHQYIIDSLEAEKPEDTAKYIIEIMWNFNHYRHYILRYYFPENNN